MLRKIRLIQNIGMFDLNAAVKAFDLKRLTLIRGDNGSGKTTFAAILRSLATGDPLPINERRRHGAEHDPKVVLGFDGKMADAIFENRCWNKTTSNLKVFDDVFVDENVYSGLQVEPRHRQKLHALILGDEGVTLARRLEDAVSRISQHNEALAEKARAIPEKARGGFSPDEFCTLTELSDIETRIKTVERSLKVAQDADAIRTRPLIASISLPKFDIETIKQILSTDLPSLDSAAEAQVQAHVKTLGESGESWVADGVKRLMVSNDRSCPFCGQTLSGSDLVAHYRAFFSTAYSQLKADVTKLMENVIHIHADGAQAAFERTVGAARQTRQFWANYCDVAQIEIDTESIAQYWNSALKVVLEVLQAKQAAPLERKDLNDHQMQTLMNYGACSDEVNALNDQVSVSNGAIQAIKEQQKATTLKDIVSELDTLKATQGRFSASIAPLCNDYLREKAAKEFTERKRSTARSELSKYQRKVFPHLQTSVNAYLDRFNAGFKIEGLKHSGIGSGSGSTSTYSVLIRKASIQVANKRNQQGKPSFGNSLSAGDRNALALSLFFSSLDQRPNLANTVVIIDDPISSLDDHRSLTTVQEVRKLALRAKQVIVLSHSSRFLSDIWKEADRNDCSSLEVAQHADVSVFREWDISHDAITEHDRRHALLQRYATTQSGVKQDVAAAIRPHLEGYLRVVCPGDFPPGKRLGQFIHECEQHLGRSDRIITKDVKEDLEEIVEYGNRFHHDGNPAWRPSEINPKELLGFVKRVLSFTEPLTEPLGE